VPINARVVPNGLDSKTFNHSVTTKKHFDQQFINQFNDAVICVGRIEARKNQLNLIKALSRTKYKLFLIGKKSVNQDSYFQECKRAAESNVKFIEFVPQDILALIYEKARVSVLPSWFETTGLVSLEALAMGCNVVVTAYGDTRDYFQGIAEFCDPASPESILDAIEVAYNKELPLFDAANFSWDYVARKTYEAYFGTRFL
jgi:glycosyltransferase involved in cell wall biosynthesis